MSVEPNEYRFFFRDHAGAAELLHGLGALAEIEAALLQHCRESAPAIPSYKPESIKTNLKAFGWSGEVRVPPMTADHDARLINDRYDAWKAFPSGGGRVGVAVEIENWEINNDLLKFVRGRARGQIVAGVIIHGSPADVAYSFEHSLRVAEPLWAGLPVLICAPEGPGLKPYEFSAKSPTYAPFIYP